MALGYKPLKQQMTGYLVDSPGNRGSHSPLAYEPPYPDASLPWVMKTALHNLSTATEASLRQDEVKPGLSGIFHIQERMHSPILSTLPDSPGHPSSRPLGYLVTA